MTQDDINGLRAELDAAHQHIAALADAMAVLINRGEWSWPKFVQERILVIRVSEMRRTELIAMLQETRTWLERPAA